MNLFVLFGLLAYIIFTDKKKAPVVPPITYGLVITLNKALAMSLFIQIEDGFSLSDTYQYSIDGQTFNDVELTETNKFLITDLDPDTAYSVTVRSSTQLYSQPTPFTTLLQLTKPTIEFVDLESGFDFLIVRLTGGGTGATAFKYQISSGVDDTSTEYSLPLLDINETFTVTHVSNIFPPLQPSTTYGIILIASQGQEIQLASDELEATTTAALGDFPKDLTHDGSTETTITVSFPSITNATSYKYSIDAQGSLKLEFGVNNSTIVTQNGTTTCTIGSLSSNTQYPITIYAYFKGNVKSSSKANLMTS